MKITAELIEEIKRDIRVKSSAADGEIKGLIEACLAEMRLAGVHITQLDALAKQAVILYCKGHYGYDEKTDGFLMAYRALRDAMALSGEYEEEKDDGSDTDDGSG